MSIRPGDRFGPYEIVAAVGAGGMGEVYRAHDTRLDRFVAIKVLRRTAEGNDLAPRLEREARLIASLSHPHICPLFDIGEYEGAPFLVMEFLDGETLAARLNRGALPLEQALRLAVEIASAMDAAHRRGVVHRDLKPANVMLTRGGAKLLDFGLARFAAGHPAAALAAVSLAETTSTDVAPRTTTGGTLPYMSPEQIEGKDADHRSDVFAFGAVLYEMITGHRAFPGDRAGAIMAGILRGEPPSIRKLQAAAPEALDDLVRTCLARDPAERWQNAGDLVRVLRWIAEPRESSSRTAMSGLLRRVSWRRASLASAVAVLSVVIALSFGRAPTSAYPRHVVVLPCRPLAGAADRLYCDGIAETLTAQLAHLSSAHDVQITPAGRVRTEGVATVEQARTLLGATLALEGSLLRAGDMLRLNYALVDPLTKQQLDAVSLTAAAADPFALQDQLVQWATRVLELRLTPGEREALEARGTQVADAYTLYQEGRGRLLSYQTPADIEEAIGLFVKALERDGKYALAQAGLGEAYWRKYEATRDPAWVDRARDACAAAVGLARTLAAPHYCLGMVYVGTGQYQSAVGAFGEALERDATFDDAYLGLARAHERLGDAAAAEGIYRRAVDRRPRYWATYVWLGNFYRERARYQEAVEAYERSVALNPANALTHARLGTIYMYLGRYDDAEEACRRSAAIAPTYTAFVNWGVTLYRRRDFDGAAALLTRACEIRQSYQCTGNLARTYYWSGRRKEAEALLERAAQLAAGELGINERDVNARLSLAEFSAKLERPVEAMRQLESAEIGNDPHLLFFVALVHAQLGNRDRAFEWLGKAVKAKVPAAELTAWPELDSLRTDARFKVLISGAAGL